MSVRNRKKSTTPGRLITDYDISAEGNEVVLKFASNGTVHEFAMSYAEACKFAGRLLNRADYWACSRASARYSGHRGNFLTGDLSEAVAGGDLTEGQAAKIRSRIEQRRAICK